MIRALRSAFVAAALAAPALVACSDQKSAFAPVATSVAPAAPVEARFAAQAAPKAARHIAFRNFVVLEVDAGRVEGVLKLARDRCASPDCEVLESSYSRESRNSPAQARIRLRIAPGASEGFLEEIAKQGDVIERRSEAEDKTDQVVDVDARLRNTTELRDRLRKLLATPGASVKDLAEIEAQLARAQAELDSAAGRRQALAQETEKVAITIDIRPRREIAEAGVLAPITAAFKSIGHTLAQSVAVLITFIVAVLPWLLLLVPVAWAWRRWRRARRRQAQEASSK
jgi:hypothetical protein